MTSDSEYRDVAKKAEKDLSAERVYPSARKRRQMRNIIVYKKDGRFGGWPANHGIWSWDNEIIVGFAAGYLAKGPSSGLHKIDPTKPTVHMLARSIDGGAKWQVQEAPYLLPPKKKPAQCPESIDFTHPDFALVATRSGVRAGATSWFYISYDRCASWDGPYSLPMFGQQGIAARTDYHVFNEHDCMLFLTATKSDGSEGRVFCARTKDSGMTWQFVSWIGPEPGGWSIMPSNVRLPDGRFLVALRRREGTHNFIELFASDNEGETWQLLSTPAPKVSLGRTFGNPPSMIRLCDGRLCLTYGYRAKPYGIRARLSYDDGASWSKEIILRADAGSPDLGYPRTVQRPDGKIVTIYYFNDSADGERYIAGTIWEPNG